MPWVSRPFSKGSNMAEFKKRVAILVSANLLTGHSGESDLAHELEEEMGKLVPAFADQGMELVTLDWRKAPEQAVLYDAMLPLFVWDYFENNHNEFLTAMAKIEQSTKLFNRFKTLQWNSNKAYLDEMEAMGAATIPTVTLTQASETEILAAMTELRTDKVVIKPDIGGAAWRQVLYEEGEAFPDADQLPPGGAMVQEFLTSVQEEGEYSFLYFGGAFSHALQKKPKPGDYRVQSIYGGLEFAYTPTSEERDQARGILDVLDFTPLYARVDLLRGNDGRLLLIELEMIEPYLYLPFAEGEGGANKGAQRLARAVLKKIEV